MMGMMVVDCKKEMMVTVLAMAMVMVPKTETVPMQESTML